MKLIPALVLALACGTVAAASGSSWLWLDKDGRKVFSDRPPPPEVPEKDILKRPLLRETAPAPAALGAAPVAAPGGGSTGPGAPAQSGIDKALQEKRKAAESAEAAKRKADEDRNAQIRAENCTRAMQAKSGLDAGGRMSRINENGERVYLDEAGIAAESARLQGIIAENCR